MFKYSAPNLPSQFGCLKTCLYFIKKDTTPIGNMSKYKAIRIVVAYDIMVPSVAYQ